MMRPTHSRSFGLIVYHQFFSKKYFLENPIWRIVVFLLANFTCQLKAPGRGQGCLCGLFDSPLLLRRWRRKKSWTDKRIEPGEEFKIEVLRIEETPTWKGKLCRKGGIVSSRYPPPLTFATNTSALLTRNTLTLFTTNTLTCTRTIMSTWGWDQVERTGNDRTRGHCHGTL